MSLIFKSFRKLIPNQILCMQIHARDISHFQHSLLIPISLPNYSISLKSSNTIFSIIIYRCLIKWGLEQEQLPEEHWEMTKPLKHFLVQISPLLLNSGLQHLFNRRSYISIGLQLYQNL